MSNTKTSYDAYLASAHWGRLRRSYFAAHPRQCFVCEKANRVIQLHHRTYAHLGAEPHEDLVPMCSSCHRVLHLDENWHADSHIELRRTFLEGGASALKRIEQLGLARGQRSPKAVVLRDLGLSRHDVVAWYPCSCGALPGERCRSSKGNRRKTPHRSRFQSLIQGRPGTPPKRPRNRSAGAMHVLDAHTMTEAQRTRYALTKSSSPESVASWSQLRA